MIDSAPDLYVTAHEGQIHQVIVNLVDNALDAVAGRHDPAVWLKASRDGATVKLVIRDNGPGIADTDLAKVFEPFFTTKTVGEGTGLGLWISFSIITESGGTLVAGNSETGGAEFQIQLPCETAS